MKSGSGRLGWLDVIEAAPTQARVLIVDDEVDVRRALRKLVAKFGYDAVMAASAEEADQAVSGGRFDVCLLDIELPHMKGVEFLSWALKRDPEMAVIMLTGVDLPEVAVECLDHGARSYLVKPVESDYLRLAIRDALAVRRLLVERNDRPG